MRSVADAADAEVKCTLVGTPGYIAPEILTYSEYHDRVDTWSLGVVFFVMLVGGLPFPQSDRKEVPAQCVPAH